MSLIICTYLCSSGSDVRSLEAISRSVTSLIVHPIDLLCVQESREDHGAVSGEYRVALPDGRIQIVTYHADENGYVADVKYEGVANPGPGLIIFPIH